MDLYVNLSNVRLQQKLSFAQSTRVIGALFVSPIKALASTAQVIAGLAGTILLGALHVITFGSSSKLGDLLNVSVSHLIIGTSELLYSAVNLLTMGIFGYCFEKKRDEFFRLNSFQTNAVIPYQTLFIPHILPELTFRNVILI